MGRIARFFCVLIFLGCVAFLAVNGVSLWPMPESFSHGSRKLYLSKDFGLRTDYNDVSGILKDGFSRFLDVVGTGHVVAATKTDPTPVIQGLHVVVASPDEELQFGVDESYKLFIHEKGIPIYAKLEAQTVYGALHGLETFSQLCHFNFTTRIIEVPQSPWVIIDKPRFSYRGLLIDSSRHYLPLPVIKNVIDSMTYAKLNVLHWHIVDTQSFPLEIPSYPKLWNGAYSVSERYTMADAAEIVQYAQRRGIHILAEIDVPGHAFSWGIGYPSLWPSSDCPQPLDVSSEFTFKVIDGILSDFSKVFKFKFVHLGGDEVDTSCWIITPHIKNWLISKGLNESQAYEYFVLRAQAIALSHGYEIVNWEETFNHFGNRLSRRTVVHNCPLSMKFGGSNREHKLPKCGSRSELPLDISTKQLVWLGGGVAPEVVAAGLRCIVSNQDKWYLDHLDTPWQEFYVNEPLTNISKPEQQKLVLGGEVCMWGENIDGSDIQQTIWPRAAAAAERLWTPYRKLAKDPEEVTGRLARFRCLLNQRGVAAAPLAGPGRVAPPGPGSCYKQ